MVIGAFAAIAHGAPIDATYDVDVTPQPDPQNFQCLSLALADLGARIRVNDLEQGLPFAHDAGSLARMDMLNLTCPAGTPDRHPKALSARVPRATPTSPHENFF